MAITCHEFLDHATRQGGALTPVADAHLATCPDCDRWYVEVQPALALFALASCETSGQHLAAHGQTARKRESALAPLLVERQTISQRTIDGTCTPVGDESSIDASQHSVALRKNRWRRLGNALARVAAAMVVLALAVSFLQQPESDDAARAALPASLIDRNATLDSIGLVTACLETSQIDPHTARVGDHLRQLPCCTRCHQAQPGSSAGLANGAVIGETAHSDSFTIGGKPKLRAEKLSLISASCLLCHNG